MMYFMNRAVFLEDVEKVPRSIKKDAFNNAFLVLAERFHDKLIVSGDRHLLDLGSYQRILIVAPAEAVQVFEKMWRDAAG